MYSSADIVNILVKDFDRSIAAFENINNNFVIDKPFNSEQKKEFEECVRKCLSMFAFQNKEVSSKYITIYIRFGKFNETLRNKCRLDGLPFFGEKFKKTSLNMFTNVSPHFQAINSVIIKELNNICAALNDPNEKSLLTPNTLKIVSNFLPVYKKPYFLLSGLGTLQYKNINIKKFQICVTFTLEKEKVVFRITEEQYREINDPKNPNPKEINKFTELLKWISDKNSNNSTTVTNFVLPDSATLHGDSYSNCRLAKAYEKFSLKQDTSDEKNGIDNIFLKEELEQCEPMKKHDTGFTLALAQLGKPSVVICNLKYNVKCVVNFSNSTATNDFFNVKGYEDEYDYDNEETSLAETSQDIYDDFIAKDFATILKMTSEKKNIVEIKTLKDVASSTPKVVVNESLLKQIQDDDLDEKSDIDSDEE